MTFNRDNPYPLVLEENRLLNKSGSKKETRHLELNLGESAIKYKVGDSLGVWPKNDPTLVQDVLQHMGHSGKEEIDWEDSSYSLMEVLAKKVSLHKITRQLIPNLMEACSHPREKALLTSLQSPENKENFKSEYLDPLDVMSAAPSAKLSPQDLIHSLGKMTPRLYSIASSQKAVGESVHLTVAVVNTLHNGRLRDGVCSTYMCHRVPVHQPMKSFVQASRHFHPPKDPDTPMIMVGPGTGIAPFRAFLQERQAEGAKGKNWLFFGDQHQATDYLYEEEFEALHKDGFLTNIDLAFSRDQDYKIYVQNRMIEKSKELWKWLEDGAAFYVCGDAKYMAKDVDKALFEIVQKEGQKDDAQTKEYIKQMKKDNRLQKDVY